MQIKKKTYRFDAHAVEHVDDVLRGHIASGSFGKRTATESGHWGIHNWDAHLKGRKNIGQCLAVSIMTVDGNYISRQVLKRLRQKVSHFDGRANANCVTEWYFIAAHFVQLIGQLSGFLWLNEAFIWTAQTAGDVSDVHAKKVKNW